MRQAILPAAAFPGGFFSHVRVIAPGRSRLQPGLAAPQNGQDFGRSHLEGGLHEARSGLWNRKLVFSRDVQAVDLVQQMGART